MRLFLLIIPQMLIVSNEDLIAYVILTSSLSACTRHDRAVSRTESEVASLKAMTPTIVA